MLYVRSSELINLIKLSVPFHQMVAAWKKRYDKPGQCIKKQRHHFVNKGLYSQSYGISSCHVQRVQPFFLRLHTNDTHTGFVFLCFISYCITSFMFICVVSNGRISFLFSWPNNIPLYLNGHSAGGIYFIGTIFALLCEALEVNIPTIPSGQIPKAN